MGVTADILIDRQRLKQHLSRWRVAALAFLGLFLLALLPAGPLSDAVRKDHIALLPLEGFIRDDPELLELLDELKEDERVQALILRIDSPGGTAVGGEVIYEKLREIADQKPVVATLRTMATSGGYMAALGADYILVREGTITGSIGVIFQSVNVRELAEKIGLEPVIIKSAPLKGSPNPFESVTEPAKAMVQRTINDFYDYFLGLVIERRGLEPEKAKRLADGRIMTGKKAVEVGLADAVGGPEEAQKWLEEKGITEGLKLHEYTLDEPDSSSFLTMAAQRIGLLPGSSSHVFPPAGLVLSCCE